MKTIRLFFIYFLLIYYAGPSVYGQDIRFDHISMDQGLVNNTVNCVYQDSHGFMWFGTLDGLNRYDGYEFKSYKTDPADPYSISGNTVTAITEDKSDSQKD